MANPRTIARLEARILQRAAYCVEFELNDPRSAFITLTHVKLTNDLAGAHIKYSVLGSPSERSKVEHMLVDASGFIQRQVGRVLQTRRVPRLTWEYDDSIEHAAEMDRRIREALERDRAINPSAHAEAPKPEAVPEDEDEEGGPDAAPR